jgi:hypothetical protein
MPPGEYLVVVGLRYEATTMHQDGSVEFIRPLAIRSMLVEVR